MLRITFVLGFILLINHVAVSQTGPGGVGANDGTTDLIIWYRSDNGIGATGSNVDTWVNSAGYNAHDLVYQGSGTQPTLTSGSVNSYDEVRFYDSGFLYTTASNLTVANFVTNAASSFMATNIVTKTNSYAYSTYPLSTNRFSAHVPWGDNVVYYDIGQCCGTASRLQVAQPLAGYYNYSVWSYGANTATGKQLYRNGTLLQSRNGTSTFNRHALSRFQIGERHNGNISELVVFKSKVNTAQRFIIQNYISAKFNIALTANDLYAQDDAINGNFDHDVAGIGQATDGTNHTDSQGTGIVRMNTPSALTNGDYLFWGEETKDPTYDFSTNTSNYYEELNSKWRVSKANDLGTVTVAFDVTGVDLTGKQNCRPLQLVVDNDSDFSSPTSVYDLTIVGSTATATIVSFTDGDFFTLRYVDQIVWDGTTFYNGSGAASAPDNTDACLKFTVKPTTNGVLTFDAHVREVEVELGATLNVNDGILLEVEEDVVLNGDMDLLGEAQLIQNHSNITSNSGTGSLKKRQQGTINLHNYNYWSSPVNRSGNWQIGYLEDGAGIVNYTSSYNADPSTSPTTISNRWFYELNSSVGYTGWSALTSATDIPPGIGYTMKGSGSTTGSEYEYIFRGVPNDGNYSFSVTAGNEFLVGNPYPSAIDADDFISDNVGVIDGTLRFWEHFGSNSTHLLADYQGGYATYTSMMGTPAMADNSGLTSGLGSGSKTPTNRIPVGQGFMVTISNPGNVVFNNQQRKFARESLSESVFIRNSSAPVEEEDLRTKLWFSFTAPNGFYRVIGLGYDSSATLGYDRGLDAKTFENASHEAHWKPENMDSGLIIQALPELIVNQELPITLKTSQDAIYKFAITSVMNLPSDMSVFLKDNAENALYDITTSEIALPLEEGLFENRFSIFFENTNALSIDKNEDSIFNILYDSLNEVIILNGFEIDTRFYEVHIFNVLGQNLMSIDQLEGNRIDVSNLKDGVYLLELSEKNSSIRKGFSKKFLKF